MQIPVIHHDRALHFVYGDLAALLGWALARIFGAPVPPAAVGMAVCAAFALGREAWNKRNGGRWSWADVGWTVGGGCTAMGPAALP